MLTHYGANMAELCQNFNVGGVLGFMSHINSAGFFLSILLWYIYAK